MVLIMNSKQMIEQLVGFNTVSRDSNLSLIDFVQNYLNDHGVASTRVVSDDGEKSNLYATIGPLEEGGVVLSGHTDVVPVDGQDWHTDPFLLTEDNGRRYGRGTCDMKGFIGIALSLVPDMKLLRRPIHLALSYDEEVGCRGAPAMIEQMVTDLPAPEAVIVGEPTSMSVVTGLKGIVGLKTTVRGYETHSSQTNRGVSAVMNAARLVSYLSAMAERLERDTPSDNGFNPHHTSIHVGVINGGTAMNIVSRHCEFVWDVRNIPGDDPDALIEEFEKYCKEEVLPEMRQRWSECFIQTEVIARAPEFSPKGSAALELVQAITGTQDTSRGAYVAEAGQFQAAGFPTVMCGPGSIDQAHQPDEFISLEQVAQGESFLRRLIQDLST